MSAASGFSIDSSADLNNITASSTIMSALANNLIPFKSKGGFLLCHNVIVRSNPAELARRNFGVGNQEDHTSTNKHLGKACQYASGFSMDSSADLNNITASSTIMSALANNLIPFKLKCFT